jgi:hypothetical protein
MTKQLETPFDNIESAHEYIRMLREAVLESLHEINGEIGIATTSALERRLRALQIVSFKLQKLEQQLQMSSRMLNDLRILRSLLKSDATAAA